jgi:flagellar M-ring protein FliF
MTTTGTQPEKGTPLQIAGTPSLQASLGTLWTRARVRWASMTAKQRRGSAAAAALLLGLVVGIFWYGLHTEWRTLYAGLDPDDARQTGLTLTQAQIPFDVSANGTAILVPAPMLDKARLATAAKGGVRSGRLGFELFDRPNWVGSEFDERVNYQRALEGELEHTVGALADIDLARVHLVMPHDSLFRDEERPAKATVVLKLRHASLAEGEADSIRNLVASAVDGLAPDHVVLVDAAGRLQLGPKTAEGELLSAEQALEDKLIATLEPVTGVGNVRASVTVDYDESNSEETRETYDPDKTATLSMQRTEQLSGGQPVPTGVPGTASNAPNSQALPVYPKLTAPPETSKSEASTYGVSKDVRRVVQSPGRVRRLTAAIVVNHRLQRAASKGGTPQWQPWSADQLRNLTTLAQAAVGFDPSRGDVLTVEDLAFDDNNSSLSPSLPSRFLMAAERSPELVKYVALFLALLLVLALGVRPALRLARVGQAVNDGKQEHSAIRELPEPPGTQPATESLELTPPDPERLRAQQLFEQLTDHLKREPAQSTRLLQSWIHSE